MLLTDEWSAIRDAFATRLSRIIDSFTISQLETKFFLELEKVGKEVTVLHLQGRLLSQFCNSTLRFSIPCTGRDFVARWSIRLAIHETYQFVLAEPFH